MTVLRIHPENPARRKLQMVVDALQKGELVSYPTDSLYAVGCDPANKKAVLNLCRLKQIDPRKANLTFLCQDLAQCAPLVRQLDRNVFRVIRRNVPGPFTFILPASKEASHFFQNRKKTIGIRIPDHVFVQELLSAFGHPILTTSLVQEDELYDKNFETLHDEFKHLISVMVDDEQPLGLPSAIVSYEPENLLILRDGPIALKQ